MNKKLGILGDTPYIPYHFKTEKTFGNHVRKHVKVVFGKDAVFFNLKPKMRAPSGRGSIPDGYVISFSPPYPWHLVEFELLRKIPISAAKHDHIAGQLNQFMSSVRVPGSVNTVLQAVYNAIKAAPALEKRVASHAGGDIHDFLTNKVFSKPPVITVIVELQDAKDEVRSICENCMLETRLVEFETYVKKASREHFHITDAAYDAEEDIKWTIGQVNGKITPQKEYGLPILASLISLGGKAPCKTVLKKVGETLREKMVKKDFERIACDEPRWISLTRWEARRLKAKGYVLIGSPPGTWEITGAGRQYYLDSAATCPPLV